ncbi:hypothetical protein LTR08_000459 [Meristemomyces frigidus]|nr:hypothetical protein LTR08_000459 [Meristemomyces frigidus]
MVSTASGYGILTSSINTSKRREKYKSTCPMQGFFSLAQANFKAPNSRRYGQDYYDGRTKASRRCRYGSDGASLHLTVLPTDGSASQTTTSKETNGEDPVQQATPPMTPAQDPDEDEQTSSAAPQEEKSATSSEDSVAKGFRDPLHWYGILVPRELRNAQRLFASALDDPMVRVASCARQLRIVEGAIIRARKAVRRAEKAGVVA